MHLFSDYFFDQFENPLGITNRGFSKDVDDFNTHVNE
jgi:hypothetical protein